MYFDSEIEPHRIGITLNSTIIKKLRKRQAEMIRKTKKSVTLSSVIRDALEKS